MPYLILVFGLIIGLFALYRFFIKADVNQIKALFLTAGFVAFCLALFYLSITGRLPAALALVVATIPFVISHYKERRKNRINGESSKTETPQVGTAEEALEILGLKPGASEDEIQSAYKKLMQKVHPDNEGSDWIASKLNQARDILLNNK